VETFIHRSTFKAFKGDFVILFHPAVSSNHAVIASAKCTEMCGTSVAAADALPPGSHFFSNGEIKYKDGSGHILLWKRMEEVLDHAHCIAPLLGTPNASVSHTGRCTGGHLSLKLQGDQSLRGQVSHRVLARQEVRAMNIAQIASTFDSPSVPTMNIRPNFKKSFSSPLDEPGNYDNMMELRPRFDPQGDDPFSVVAILVKDLDWGGTTTAPIIEISYAVDVQFQLGTDIEHMATQHQVKTKAQQESLGQTLYRGLVMANKTVPVISDVVSAIREGAPMLRAAAAALG
jgi:hypothetical protein